MSISLHLKKFRNTNGLQRILILSHRRNCRRKSLIYHRLIIRGDCHRLRSSWRNKHIYQLNNLNRAKHTSFITKIVRTHPATFSPPTYYKLHASAPRPPENIAGCYSNIIFLFDYKKCSYCFLIGVESDAFLSTNSLHYV